MRPESLSTPKGSRCSNVSIVQGSLILAKASESNRVLVENIEQFRAYLQLLFGRSRGSTANSRPKSPSNRGTDTTIMIRHFV